MIFQKGHKHSEGIKTKLSEKMKGRHVSLKTEFKKGHKLSEITKRKMKGNKNALGYKHSIKAKQKISEARKGTKISDIAKRLISLATKGEKHWNWKGGITSITQKLRDSIKYKEWRQQILIRDNFTCQKCGARSGNGRTIYLEVHHKTSFSKLIEEVKKYLPLLSLFDGAMAYTPLWDINNGITLCEKCHNKRR